jgi:hypothetical protein
MGIAATSPSERLASSIGSQQEAKPKFEHSDNVCQAGVLLLLPSLLSQGLLKAKEIYGKLSKGYYGLVTMLLVMAYMSLSRIKTPEAIKHCKPGEFGKIIGLDRVPEVKCLRAKIEEIVGQNKAGEFNRILAQGWISDEECFYFYIDGHVRVYHGHKAKLTKKYVSREKLCLAGTTEFWINNELGLPYLVFSGELNEKLKNVIIEQIIPELLEDTAPLINSEELLRVKNKARFTIIFDREAYEPQFFRQLWEGYRIAVITYRKSVKDKWDKGEFSDCITKVIGKEISISLAERTIELGGMQLREIRKLSDNGHQCSILTTNEELSMEIVGGKMFSRWSQENFFKYMLQDYELDKAIEYGIEAIEFNKTIVNPFYKELTYKLKKLREKQSRLKSRLFAIVDKNLDASIEQLKEKLQEQADIIEKIKDYQQDIDEKLKERKQIPYYLALKDIPEENRYNKLKTESKLFINTIKMIAFRAETSVVNLITPYYSRAEDEARMLVKEIIKSDADLIPDYNNNTLTVVLHCLSTPRANRAAENLCDILNATETIYPGTELKLIYKSIASNFT